jgi:hypothetical protein
MRAALLVAVALAASACARPAGTQRQAIGSACADDAACGSGGRFHCATDHPGGYCEATCRRDADCGAGNVCVGGGVLSRGDCHVACAAASTCRSAEGYRCIAAGDDATHDYCDPPGRSEIARRIRGRAWRW